MFQTRQAASTKLPIQRKGTKYVAKARTFVNDSVPVVIATRDMLKLARTAREVRKMINEKMLKINGRIVKDYRDSICLFNQFEAGKTFQLILLRTGKFAFKELNKAEYMVFKVKGKNIIKKGKIQLNLHDGTNILIDKKNIVNGDSVYLDDKKKIVNHISLEKGGKAFVIRGKHQGLYGVIESIEDNNVSVKLENGGTVNLKKDILFVLK
ncbi:hypothetical protein HYW75_04655 [Candidatus Pacearchaeota archaeon]|nr:hypothetical protein [Candidatus Pacearchaeota archaeon]